MGENPRLQANTSDNVRHGIQKKCAQCIRYRVSHSILYKVQVQSIIRQYCRKMHRSNTRNLLRQLHRYSQWEYESRSCAYANFSTTTSIDIKNRAIYKREKQQKITMQIPRIKEKILGTTFVGARVLRRNIWTNKNIQRNRKRTIRIIHSKYPNSESLLV